MKYQLNPGFLEDIFVTDSKKIHDNNLIQQSFDVVSIFVTAIDTNGNISLINKRGATLLGYEKMDIISKNFIKEFITEEKQARAQNIFHKIIRGEKYNNEKLHYHLKCKNGIKIIEAEITKIKDKEDEFIGIIISGQDVTKHIEEQQELSTDVALYRLLANNIPDINLFLFDKKMHFILAEGNEMKNNDMNREYFEGNTLNEIPDKTLKKIWDPLFRSAIRGKQVSTKYTYNNYSYEIRVLPILNKEMKVSAGVAITKNVTEDKQIERELRKSKAEAEKANLSKTDFLARVSHEIRTPLNAILGFTEQLSQTNLDDQQRNFLTIIEKSSNHLLCLINDLLVLSKIEARQLKFEKTPFYIRSTVKYIFNTLESRAAEKDLHFSYSIDNKLDRVLLGDPFRLQQILINLLTNAIKFTNKGFVKLDCYVQKEYEKNLKVYFEVTDSGIGIDQENLKSIFKSFKQEENLSRLYQGTGLGLTICKNLIELQKGTLSVSSKKGSGTKFSFTLPYPKGKIEDMSLEKEDVLKYSNLKNKKTLLVDDDNYNRLLGKTILDKFQCNTEVAKNGKEAIEHLKSKAYEIVLLDIHMQDINGIEVANYIRKNLKDNDTKIIAVTAAILKDNITSYYKAGINDILIKPYKEIALYNKMSNVLKVKKQSSKKIDVAEIVKESDPGFYSLDGLKEMAAGDQVFITNMIQTFINNSKESITLLKKYSEENNREQIGETAHKMLPSFRHLEVNEIIPFLEDMKEKTMSDKDNSELTGLIDQTISKINVLLTHLNKEINSLK